MARLASALLLLALVRGSHQHGKLASPAPRAGTNIAGGNKGNVGERKQVPSSLAVICPAAYVASTRLTRRAAPRVAAGLTGLPPANFPGPCGSTRTAGNPTATLTASAARLPDEWHCSLNNVTH